MSLGHRLSSVPNNFIEFSLSVIISGGSYPRQAGPVGASYQITHSPHSAISRFDPFLVRTISGSLNYMIYGLHRGVEVPFEVWLPLN